MRRFSLETPATSCRVGHFGDIYQELRQIHDSLPKRAPQRSKLLQLARGIADFEGSPFNIDGFWPEAR